MKAVLHPYQNRAVEFIINNPHSALLLDMGLGKSLITLTAISKLIDYAEIGSVLVVAPKKVSETTWTDEVNKWGHLQHLKVSKVIGTEKQRIDALKAKADIYVLGRDSFVWLVQYYRAKLPFDMLVLDELTSFKGNTSKRFKAMRLVRSQFLRIVGLTGTPAPNGYLDLWAEMFCIDGGQRLGKFITHYRQNYFNCVTAQQGYILKCTLRKGAKEEIDGLLSDICIAMKAEDYLTLPDRQDIVQNVYLPDAVMKRYREFEKEMVLSVKDDKQITAASAAALMGKLLQFTNGAVYEDDSAPDGARWITDIHNEKVSALVEIVENAGSPVLVFYQFRHDINRIKDALKGYKVRLYETEQDLKDWNNNKIDVLLAHPSSCAYGLNLQAGGHIIVWFGVGFNLELYQQACARLHRQGQKHPVQIYHLVCPGTVDERAMTALRNKADGQNALLNSLKVIINKYK